MVDGRGLVVGAAVGATLANCNNNQAPEEVASAADNTQDQFAELVKTWPA